MVAKYLESEDSRELARLVREALESYRNTYGIAIIFVDVVKASVGQGETLYNVLLYAPKNAHGLSEYIRGFLAHNDIEIHHVPPYILSFKSLPE